MPVPSTDASVLIVEDENIIALDLKRTLNRLGHYVAAIAPRGAEAVAKVVELRPDLVLMDIRLPSATSRSAAAPSPVEQLTT